jgi:hypothetical protein
MVGELVGFKVGETVGTLVGFKVGETEGTLVVGESEGGSVVGAKEMEGAIVGGLEEGDDERTSVGTPDGLVLGRVEGAKLSVGEMEAEGAGVIRSLAAAAKSVLAARRTAVSSMYLIVNLMVFNFSPLL